MRILDEDRKSSKKRLKFLEKKRNGGDSVKKKK